MSDLQDRIRKLTRQLYPTGRAFRYPIGGIVDRLHKSLALSEERAIIDSESIYNSILPDNVNFTADDATRWEQRLGMIVSPNVPLSDRKLAILRKMNHPGTIPARENYLFIQQQLRAAGFDVYVHENPNRLAPGELLQSGYYPTLGSKTLGSFTLADPYEAYNDYILTLGNFTLGFRTLGGYSTYGNKVVNSLDQATDAAFYEGTNLASTFYVGGEQLGTFATVDAARKTEFRQLLLRLKPVQTVGYLFITYI